MALSGATQREIARIYRIDPDTLAAHCRDELFVARWKKLGKIASNIYRAALDPEKPDNELGLKILRLQAGWTGKARDADDSPAPDPAPPPPEATRKMTRKETRALVQQVADLIK